MTRSDAQGVVEAQHFLMGQCWGNGLNAEDTAKKVDEASMAKTVPIEKA